MPRAFQSGTVFKMKMESDETEFCKWPFLHTHTHTHRLVIINSIVYSSVTFMYLINSCQMQSARRPVSIRQTSENTLAKEHLSTPRNLFQDEFLEVE